MIAVVPRCGAGAHQDHIPGKIEESSACDFARLVVVICESSSCPSARLCEEALKMKCAQVVYVSRREDQV